MRAKERARQKTRNKRLWPLGSVRSERAPPPPYFVTEGDLAKLPILTLRRTLHFAGNKVAHKKVGELNKSLLNKVQPEDWDPSHFTKGERNETLREMRGGLRKALGNDSFAAYVAQWKSWGGLAKETSTLVNKVRAEIVAHAPEGMHKNLSPELEIIVRDDVLPLVLAHAAKVWVLDKKPPIICNSAVHAWMGVRDSFPSRLSLIPTKLLFAGHPNSVVVALCLQLHLMQVDWDMDDTHDRNEIDLERTRARIEDLKKRISSLTYEKDIQGAEALSRVEDMYENDRGPHSLSGLLSQVRCNLARFEQKNAQRARCNSKLKINQRSALHLVDDVARGLYRRETRQRLTRGTDVKRKRIAWTDGTSVVGRVAQHPVSVGRGMLMLSSDTGVFFTLTTPGDAATDEDRKRSFVMGLGGHGDGPAIRMRTQHSCAAVNAPMMQHHFGTFGQRAQEIQAIARGYIVRQRLRDDAEDLARFVNEALGEAEV